MGLVKCLLKAFAMSMLWCKDLLLKEIVIFLGGCVFLLLSVCMVLQSLCELILCEQLDILSNQMFCLC